MSEELVEFTLSHEGLVFEGLIEAHNTTIQVWRANDGTSDGFAIEMITEEGGAVVDFLDDEAEAVNRAQHLVTFFFNEDADEEPVA